jgi:rhamnose utilization protein RhaD (predicted bifunctional aldolase and dehydrogenase)
MCSQKAEAVCKNLFGHTALFVPYTDPGYILFKRVAEGIRDFAELRGYEPQIIFLENHGVFVGADSTDEINFIYDQIMTKIEGKLVDELPCNKKTELKSVLIDHIETLHPGFAGFAAMGFQSDLHKRFVIDENMFKKANKSFTPDDIVYCKAHYLYIPSQTTEKETLAQAAEKISDYYNTYGYLPKVLALQGEGIVGVEENLKSARNVLDVYENILKISFYTEKFGGPKFLNDEQIAFIDNWEVENYRRKIAKS